MEKRPPHWKSRRVIRALFCLLIISACLVGAASAATDDLYLGGTQLYSDGNWQGVSGWTETSSGSGVYQNTEETIQVTYDSSEKRFTISLNNAKIINSNTGSNSNSMSAIYADATYVDIIPIGTNTLTASTSAPSAHGIYAGGILTIDGYGTLDVTAGGTYGLYSWSNIFIKNATVNVTASFPGSTDVGGQAIFTRSGGSGTTIDNATVKADGRYYALNSYKGITLKNNSAVEAIGGAWAFGRAPALEYTADVYYGQSKDSTLTYALSTKSGIPYTSSKYVKIEKAKDPVWNAIIYEKNNYGTDVQAGETKDFGKLSVDSNQEALTFTVKNDGNRDLTDLTLEITDNEAGAFTISSLSENSIAVGSSVTFTVKPNTSAALLPTNTYQKKYTAKIAVKNATDEYDNITVSFTLQNGEPSIWVSGVPYYADATETGWSYDADTKTLTVTGDITNTDSELTSEHHGAAIYTTDTLHLVVNENAKLTAATGGDYALYASTLDIKGVTGKTLEVSGEKYGIYVWSNLNVYDITVNASGTANPGIYAHSGGQGIFIYSGEVNAKSDSSSGISVESGNNRKITINGGTVTAQGSNAFGIAPAIYSGSEVYAGDAEGSEVVVTSPTDATYTGSKYVKIAPSTTNAELAYLSVNGTQITLTPEIYTYQADDVSLNVVSVPVEATPVSPVASVTVTGNASLAFGDNTITVTVTNGGTSKEYKVTLKRINPITVKTNGNSVTNGDTITLKAYTVGYTSRDEQTFLVKNTDITTPLKINATLSGIGFTLNETDDTELTKTYDNEIYDNNRAVYVDVYPTKNLAAGTYTATLTIKALDSSGADTTGIPPFVVNLKVVVSSGSSGGGGTSSGGGGGGSYNPSVNPSTPTTPTTPEVPVTPEVPDVPETPDTPEEPEQPTDEPETPTETPAPILGMVLGGLAAAVVLRRK